jgi:hypothetical protein
MTGNRRLVLLRVLLTVLAVEGALFSVAAVGFGVASFAVHDEGDELAGLDVVLVVAAIVSALLATLAGVCVKAVRDTLRRGDGPMARPAALGLVHLWSSLFAFPGPWWVAVACGVPGVFYLVCWKLLKERPYEPLLMPRQIRRGADDIVKK